MRDKPFEKRELMGSYLGNGKDRLHNDSSSDDSSSDESSSEASPDNGTSPDPDVSPWRR
jgi:hypothetical protein